VNILIIQTAFTGDVILATPLIEKLHRFYPHAHIDFLLRMGNEGLLEGHPLLHEVIIWDKKSDKQKNLLLIINKVRSKNYDIVVNAHRFLSSGLITYLSDAKETIGFDKNPLSLMFTKRIAHVIGDGTHEVQRNLNLITHLTDDSFQLPKLYPSAHDYADVRYYTNRPYVCIAPTSVWYTKQLPKEKWVELIPQLSSYNIYLIGGPGDFKACNEILNAVQKSHSKNSGIINLAGKLTYLQSAALIHDAAMNFVNDSAPLHMASAMNANVTAVFCSTISDFGFGPLSDHSKVVETSLHLDCRPCGLHGYQACPKGHFKCALTIEVKDLKIRKLQDYRIKTEPELPAKKSSRKTTKKSSRKPSKKSPPKGTE
jgi:ADP-heptose:LPS heptosyltransferase